MCLSTIKKCISLLFLLSFFAPLVAERYQITSISYEITGITKEYPLRQAVKIDTEKIFSDYTELTIYLEFLKQEFINQRVLEYAEIYPLFRASENGDIIPINLLIKTKDSFNIFGFPYPNYNSNSGLTLKLKLKDYNFLGSMRPLSFDFNYAWKTGASESDTKHIIGFNIGADYPFKIGIVNSVWDNYFNIDYTIGQYRPSLEYSTGINFSLPLKVTALNFSIRQKIILNNDYFDIGDYLHFDTGASFSMPFTIAKIPNWGSVNWSPYFSINYKWAPNGIHHPDFFSPVLAFGHSVSTGRIDWIENFRKGFEASFSQSASYNIQNHTFSPNISAEFKFFRASKYVGLDSRVQWFRNINGTSEIGGQLRGIKDSQTGIGTPSAVSFNIAMPIRIFRSNWVGWGLWNWTKYIDLELQLSPFVDFALFENTVTGSAFNYKDGWYSGGLELIGYPTRFRSIQGRVSFGVDLARTIPSIPARFLNLQWRDATSRWELTIGLGLFF